MHHARSAHAACDRGGSLDVLNIKPRYSSLLAPAELANDDHRCRKSCVASFMVMLRVYHAHCAPMSRRHAILMDALTNVTNGTPSETYRASHECHEHRSNCLLDQTSFGSTSADITSPVAIVWVAIT